MKVSSEKKATSKSGGGGFRHGSPPTVKHGNTHNTYKGPTKVGKAK